MQSDKMTQDSLEKLKPKDAVRYCKLEFNIVHKSHPLGQEEIITAFLIFATTRRGIPFFGHINIS